MEIKIFSLVLFTAILLLMTITAVSVAQADLITVTQASDFTKSKLTTSFDIKNLDSNNSVTLAISSVDKTIEDNDGRKITVSVDKLLTSIDAGATETVEAEITIDPNFDFKDIKLDKHLISTVTIDAALGTDSETVTLSFVNGFCDFGEIGNLEITELKDKELDNEDAWDWAPLDDVEFRVEVFNDFDNKERIRVEYEIRDSSGKKVDFDGKDTEQSVSITDGDSEKVTFSLRVPADIEDGNYKLFIKASLKGKEDEGCVDSSDEFSKTFYQEISVDRDEERAIIVDIDKIQIPESVNCGEFATVYAKIYNIGEEDEEKVKVNLFNSELGINMDEVVNDLEEGESATVTFNFKVPENIEAKNYFFRLITFYEYDEDEDEYDSNSAEDLDESFNFILKVNCVEEKKSAALITAELDSDAIAGEQLVIKGTIKNTGEKETTYSLRVTGYSSWSGLEELTPSTITLEPGKSGEFLITLNVNEDVEGEQFFTIKADHDSGITEQEISVIIEGKEKKTAITGSAIGESLRENWFIWVIVIINIVLIITIILVARRIATAR